jgi:hypothetical protein
MCPNKYLADYIHINLLKIFRRGDTPGFALPLFTSIYRITANFCGVKFLRFWSKKMTFNFCGFFFFCGFKISAPKKKIVCINAKPGVSPRLKI